jgi:hypothetical protein
MRSGFRTKENELAAASGLPTPTSGQAKESGNPTQTQMSETDTAKSRVVNTISYQVKFLSAQRF